MSLPDLFETMRRIESPLFQGARELFVAKHGKLKYAVGGRTSYKPTGLLDEAGVIIINRLELEGYARVFGSTLEALRTCLSHEMGHFMDELQSMATRPAPTAPLTAHIDWCYMQEARATLFAYKVAKELTTKGLPAHVLAPTSTLNVFDAMAEAERTGQNLIMLAKSYYAADSHYTATCRSQVPMTAQGMPAMAVVRIVGKRPARAAGARR